MNRKNFLKAGTLVGAVSLIGSPAAFAKNLTDNDIDKLVDANGNYMLQPLPYAENFLEPYMDAETMHLHYTFHHGGAVKAANKDIGMIKKPWMKIIQKLLITGQKNYPITFHHMCCILFFGLILPTKKMTPKVIY